MKIEPLSKTREKLIRTLHAKKYRREQKLFLAEGANALSEARRGALYPLREIVVCENILDRVEDMLSDQATLPADVTVFSCSAPTIKKLSTEESPQGILAVCSGSLFSFQDLRRHPSETLVYLDGVSDPGNLGTVLRTALWFGITQFLLGPDCVDPFNTKVIRASAGALFGTEIFGPVTIDELHLFAKERGYRMTATVPRQGDPVDCWVAGEKEIILLGQEARGLAPRLIEGADSRISIPGAGMVESLNLATAASIVFYELSRARARRSALGTA